MKLKASIPLNWGGTREAEYSVTYSGYCGAETAVVPSFHKHWHDCFELLLIKEGVELVEYGDVPLTLEAGELLVIPPMLPHSTTCVAGTPMRMIVFGYAPSVIYTPGNSLFGLRFLLPFYHLRDSGGQSKPLCYRIADCPELFNRLESCAAEIWERCDSLDLRIRSSILVIHDMLFRLCLPEQSDGKPYSRYMEEIYDRIESHPDKNLSPRQLADELHISYSHLCRVVRRCYGMTAHELTEQYRIRYAERLLSEQPERDISEIGLMAGYESPSYFIDRFKKYTGSTPLSYRKLQKAVTPAANFTQGKIL